jgi:DNA topoisomerase VI subunit B
VSVTRRRDCGGATSTQLQRFPRALARAYGSFLSEFRWHWFLTLTFAEHSSLTTARTAFRRYASSVERAAGTRVYWFRVDEIGAFGRLHQHALMGNVGSLDHAVWERRWHRGHSRIVPYDSHLGAAYYVTKFIEFYTCEYELSDDTAAFLANRWAGHTSKEQSSLVTNGAGGPQELIVRARSAVPTYFPVREAPTNTEREGMKRENSFSRTPFITDRTMEFFSERELTAQFGYGMALWPLVTTKELIDNSLDVCEGTDVPPEIRITLQADALTVEDNGPGLKPEIIEHSLDYRVRISDKKYYLAPTRGQLGNALKCVWAAALVANGQDSLIEITACGLHHLIGIVLDRIRQRPCISHQTRPLVKNGTSIKLHWRGIASLKPSDEKAEFYQAETVAAALPALISAFAALNPHATFRLRLLGGVELVYRASNPMWPKWLASQPTSAHWYRPSDLRALITAYLKEGKHKTVRDFVGEFEGLSGTQYRKRVLKQTGISAVSLCDLVADGDVSIDQVERLLVAMQQASRPVKSQRLGVIGKDHLQAALSARGVSPEGFRYRKAFGTDKEGLPFVVEVAFGLAEAGHRQLILGLNHSPVFKVPSGHLSDALTDCHVQQHDPVLLLIHQVCPRFNFTDHGKGALA